MVSGDGSHVFWCWVTCFWGLVLGNMSSGVSFHVIWCLILVCQVLGALLSLAQYNVIFFGNHNSSSAASPTDLSENTTGHGCVVGNMFSGVW
jgi:hypothetical protein